MINILTIIYYLDYKIIKWKLEYKDIKLIIKDYYIQLL
jgi:hypothetical protein